LRELRTEIEIDAPPEKVWGVLTDFDSFSDWNPFIPRAAGRIEEGARLDVFIRPPGDKGMRFRPKVLAAKPGRELRWKGRLFLPWLFDGEHAFTIEPLGEGRVRFTQGERFTGLLVPLFAAKIGAEIREGFEEMNRALKTRAEAKD
jgi:hypothetical protein